MMGSAWRVAVVALTVAAVVLAFLAIELARLTGDDQWAALQDMAVAAAGLLALLVAFGKLGRHFRDLGRLRDRLSAAKAMQDEALVWPPGTGSEVTRLAQAVGRLARTTRSVPGRSERSLSAVLALTDAPMVVLDEQGRIERVNAAAVRLLETDEGADIGQSLLRTDVSRAIERARSAGEVISAVLRRPDDSEMSVRVADLGLNAGVVLVFPTRNTGNAGGLSGTRTLSLRPAPPVIRLGDDEPLAALPFVALWVATAGPGPDEGPVVAVGTVRLAGARVFRTVSLSLLIDPAGPITAEATARHGLSTRTVAGERPFAEVWPAIEEALHHCVVVGVGVDAALAVLARACAQADLPAPTLPPALDLGALAAALDPVLTGATLDRLTAAFHVPSAHAGDGTDPFIPALRQAELAAALLVRLDERGITTHGQARALLAGNLAGREPPSRDGVAS